MIAWSTTFPWIRVWRASAGYTGLVCERMEAAVTTPPCLMRTGAVGLGAGGAGRLALAMIPCPGISEKAPLMGVLSITSGGESGALSTSAIVGIKVGGRNIPD